MHGGFACVFSVFFIIGICTLLLGCNTDLEGQCISYDVVDGVAYDHKFTQRTCRQCIAHNSKGGCTAYRYYKCYSAYVKFHYNNNATCLYATAVDKESEKSAINSVKSHPIGDEMTLLKSKTSPSDCLDVSAGKDTWITGVAFLSLCAVVAMVWASATLARMLMFKPRVVPSVHVEIFATEEGGIGVY